jgi:general secretion pathway protein K
MPFAQHIDIRRTANLLEGDQAMLLALGLEEWAAQVLVRDSASGTNDHLGEDWALGLMPVTAGDGVISGEIVDLQGKINLNNLDSDDTQTVERTEQILQRLFTYCEVDDGNGLLQSLRDWLDKDEEVRSFGSEDNDYMLNKPAYLAANRPMVSPTELLLVKGASPETYACLAEHISTLPATTDLNVNTVGAEIIATLADDITMVAAQEVILDRPEGGYASIDEFLAHSTFAATGLTTDGLTLASNYFLVQARANYGESEIRLNSVCSRNSGSLTILGRSIGTY